MCRQCDQLSEKIEIRSPEEYHRLKEQASLLLKDGKMILPRATCDMEDIVEGKPWPADILQHDFRCAFCGRTFRLFADTYHGRGLWEALE